MVVGLAVDDACVCVCSSSLEVVCASVCTVLGAEGAKKTKHFRCSSHAPTSFRSEQVLSFRYRSCVKSEACEQSARQRAE